MVADALEPIVAIATPAGVGGVGIVRLSGAGALKLAADLFSRPLRARELRFGTFLDEHGEAIDEGMAVAFPGPASFTGEDVVEFHGHGGPVVLGLMVRACQAAGARLARPGEFSERAFVNGKLDLAQAEAIADLIASGSEAAARGALRSMQGAFSRAVDAVAEDVLWLRTYVEATLDFPDEEDVDHLAGAAIGERFARARQRLDQLLADTAQGQLITEGLEVALLGRPNAGKSSLLNRLAASDRAIVSDIPGTTRDLLEVDLTLKGVPVTVVDTAGLRVSGDQIEQEGVRRALARAERVDLCLLVVDAQRPELPGVLPDWLPAAGLIVVLNKVDLLAEDQVEAAIQRVLAELAQRGFDPVPEPRPISALTGSGLEQLVDRVLTAVGYRQEAAPFSARQRHREALQEADRTLAAAERWLTVAQPDQSLELFAEDLRQAHEALGRIVGRVSADDLLGEIFSSFCIGK
ncbi:MAG: tRNA uridine-5-carboxymethylaminomethyl(34) synthesis GTPase MnmE [Pseudomonadota bacterium]